MKTQLTCVAAACLAVMPAFASAWTLEADTSNVSFGSIKNDYVGEAHTFENLSGSVSDDGSVMVKVGLPSVNTNIDIRNERMIANIFGDAAAATIAASVDMDAMNSLAVGDSKVMEVDATLTFLGTETPFFINMFIMRVSEDRVLAASDAPVYLATEDLGIDAGINALQELAGLDSITRVTPLSARFFFTQ